MSDRTEDLERAFEYVRTFYNEMSKMLSDVIGQMDDEGWEAPGGEITDGLSYSLGSPDKWMFYYVYKNFTHKEVDSCIKGVVVFFNEYMNDFPTGIVCGKLNGLPKSYDKYDLYWLAYNNRAQLKELTGEVLHLTTEVNKEPFTGDLFAIPISEITSAEDVKEKIVKRLLDL